MGKIGELLAPNEPELVEKTLARLNEQDNWNDVFSTKLIELLDKIDQVKGEIRERLRSADERIKRAASVTQAESLLLEKSKTFGDASRRLELAEAAERRATSLARDAQGDLQRAMAALIDAKSRAEFAQSQSENASKQLHLAKETQSRATHLSRLTARYATCAVSLSWIAMGWTGWFLFRTRPVLWADVCFSILIVAVTGLILKGSRSDA